MVSVVFNVRGKNRWAWLAALLAAALILSACGGAQTVTLSGKARDDVLAYSEPLTDNLLAAMNEANYTRFVLNFDETMKKAVTEKAFQDMLSSTGSKLGAYQTREVATVEDTGAYMRVTYTAKFANEDGVTVRVVFSDGTSDHLISGLWFDSPKLRQK